MSRRNRRWTTVLNLAVHDIIAGIIEACYFFYSEQLISPVLNHLKKSGTFSVEKLAIAIASRNIFVQRLKMVAFRVSVGFCQRRSKGNARRSESASTVEPSWRSGVMKNSVLTRRKTAQRERLRLWNRCRFFVRAEPRRTASMTVSGECHR